MADYDATLRIMAEDGTKEAMKSVQQGLKQTYYEANRGIKTLADGTKINIEQVNRAAMRMGIPQKVMHAHLEANAVAAKKYGLSIAQVNAMSPKAASATNMLNSSLMSGVKAFAASTIGLVSIAAAAETARRGFVRFAEVDKNLRLVQNQTGLTTKRIQELGNEMLKVAKITGDSKDTMLEAFEELREKGNLTPEEAKKLLPDIAVIAKGMKNTTAAALAGAIGDIKRNLKLAPDEVKYIWEALSHVVEEYNIDVGKLGPTLSRVTEMASQWGFKSVAGMQELLTIIGVVKEATGDEGRAAEAVSHLLASIGNEALGLNLGYAPGEFFNRYKDAAEKNLPVVGMLIEDIMKSADPRKTLRDIGIRDELIVNKLIADHGRIDGAIKKTAQATGALEKGLHIAQSPSAGLERTVVVMNELLEALGKLVNMLGNTAIFQGFLDLLSGIADKLSTIVDLVEMLTTFKLPSWMSWENFRKSSYEKFAPKDKLGRPIVPFDEAERGADVGAAARAYNEKQRAQETQKEQRTRKLEEDAKEKRRKELDLKYPGTAEKFKKTSDAADKVGASLVNYAETSRPEMAMVIKAALRDSGGQYGGSMDAKYLSAGYTPSGRGYFGAAAPGGDYSAGAGRGTGYGGGTRVAPPYEGGPTGPGQYPGGGLRPSGPPPPPGRPRQGEPEGRPPAPRREGEPPPAPEGPGAPRTAVPPGTVTGGIAPQGPFSGKPVERRGVNYFQGRGDRPLEPGQLATVETPYGRVKAHPEAAADFARTAQALKDAGAPIKSFGSYNKRMKRDYLGGKGWSSHAYGAAWDIDDQTKFSPQMRAWVKANPEKWKAALAAGNMRQPLPESDEPHIEWTGPGKDDANRPPAVAGAPAAPGAQAAPQGPGGPGSAPITAGPGGVVDQEALNRRLEHLISQDPNLAGFKPQDAEKYGFKTGSAKEWAGLMSGMAGRESSYNVNTRGDKGKSHGLFQLSPQDAITYGLQKTPFTDAQLRDPDFNARMAVKIAGIRARQGGVAGRGGMADYWAGHGKPGSYLARGDVKAGKDTGVAAAPSASAPGTESTFIPRRRGLGDMKFGSPEYNAEVDRQSKMPLVGGDSAGTSGPMPQVGGDSAGTSGPMPQVGGDKAPTPSGMPLLGPEQQRDVNIRLNVNDNEMQFARASLRRQADREVREARWSSYADIGAA